MSQTVHTDVVIIGAGLAGLTAAWHLDERNVAVVRPGRDNPASYLARGGIAAAIGEEDGPDAHLEDTVEAGGKLVDRKIAEILATEGIDRMIDLFELPIDFDRDENGQLQLGREALHRRDRILHVAGDETGRHVTSAVRQALETRKGLSVVDGRALELVVDDGGRVCGVVVGRANGSVGIVLAPVVVLATGGIGGLYEKTTNPASARGEGVAMAARAGATLADLEFVQFHPTALAAKARPLPLLSEALRGQGATLIDEEGRRLMKEDPRGELAGRDAVARRLSRHRREKGPVFLDCTDIVDLEEQFPSAVAACRHRGWEPTDQPVSVVPAAHYHMGGVATDEYGRTDVAGLWAVGEVASTGVHGANRLASNSLLEAMVFGRRVGRNIAQIGGEPHPIPVERVADLRAAWQKGVNRAVDAREVYDRLEHRMWFDVGIEWCASGLEAAIEEFDDLLVRLDVCDPARLAVETARAIAGAARRRAESRGAHFRADFPNPDPEFDRRFFVEHPTAGAREDSKVCESEITFFEATGPQ